jgi:Helix-turn-helix domain
VRLPFLAPCRGRCDSLNVLFPEQDVWGRRYRSAVDIKRAAELYAQGHSLRQIGAELGVTATTVSHQLRRAGAIMRTGAAGRIVRHT